MRLESPASRLFTHPFIQGADQRKHQSSASLAFVRGIHRWSVNSPRKGPVTRKMVPFDDVIMWGCSGDNNRNNGPVQERRNSIVYTMELRLLCTDTGVDFEAVHKEGHLAMPHQTREFAINSAGSWSVAGKRRSSRHRLFHSPLAQPLRRTIWVTPFFRCHW